MKLNLRGLFYNLIILTLMFWAAASIGGALATIEPTMIDDVFRGLGIYMFVGSIYLAVSHAFDSNKKPDLKTEKNIASVDNNSVSNEAKETKDE